MILKSLGRRSRTREDESSQTPPAFRHRPAPPEEFDELQVYLNGLKASLSETVAPGLSLEGERPLRLSFEAIYMPPTLSIVGRDGFTGKVEGLEGEGEDGGGEEEDERDRNMSLGDTLRRHRHLVLVGGAGAGKTALLRFLSLTMAQRLEPQRLDLEGNYLPVLVPADGLESIFLGSEATPESLCSLAGWGGDPEVGENVFGQYLEDGRVVLLLDCPEHPFSLDLQSKVLSQAGIWKEAYPNIRCIVGIDERAHEVVFPPVGFTECCLDPIKQSAVEHLARRWFREVERVLRPERDVERTSLRKAASFMAAIRRSPGTWRLAATPGHLQRMMLVHLYRTDLSGSRLNLLREYTDVVAAEQKAPDGMTAVDRLLPAQRVALSEVVGEDPKEDFKVQIQKALLAIDRSDGWDPGRWIRGMISSGLVEPRHRGGWKFCDPLCRDYLAAREICGIANPEVPSYLYRPFPSAEGLQDPPTSPVQPPYDVDSGKLIDLLRDKGCLYLLIWCVGLSPDMSPILRAVLSQEETLFREALQMAARCLAHGRVGEGVIRRDVCSALIGLFLGDGYEMLSRWALDRLSEMEAEEVVPGIIERFESEELAVREKACEGLSRIGGAAAVAALSDRAAHDPIPSVRLAACRGLGQVGIEEAIDPLFRLALESDDTHLRVAACRSLGQIGSEIVFERMLEALNDRRSSVRAGAALTLGHIGGDRVVPPLLEALSDEYSSVRCWVIKALGLVRSKEAQEPLMSALSDEDWAVRREACIALGLIVSETAIKPLMVTLKDTYSSVRRAACEAIGRIGSTSAVSHLIRSLRDDDWAVRREAFRALIRIRPASAVDPLLRALRDKDAFVRSAAVGILGWIGNPRAGEVLVHILQDDEYSSVRRATCEALARMEGDRYTDAVRFALKDPISSVRRAALRGLCVKRPSDLKEILAEATLDSDEEVREESCEGLGSVGTGWGIDALSGLVQDPALGVRLKACEALGRCGNAGSIPSLCEILNDSDTSVRNAAFEALWRVCQRSGKTVYLKDL